MIRWQVLPLESGKTDGWERLEPPALSSAKPKLNWLNDKPSKCASWFSYFSFQFHETGSFRPECTWISLGITFTYSRVHTDLDNKKFPDYSTTFQWPKSTVSWPKFLLWLIKSVLCSSYTFFFYMKQFVKVYLTCLSSFWGKKFM